MILPMLVAILLHFQIEPPSFLIITGLHWKEFLYGQVYGDSRKAKGTYSAAACFILYGELHTQ
jgi:hypothetical protein